MDRRRCCVPGCKSGRKVPCHCFPKDTVRSRVWKEAVKNTLLSNLTSEQLNEYVVCTHHFQKDAYLVNTRRPILRKDAFPTLLLPEDALEEQIEEIDLPDGSLDTTVEFQLPVIVSPVARYTRSPLKVTQDIKRLRLFEESRTYLRVPERHSNIIYHINDNDMECVPRAQGENLKTTCYVQEAAFETITYIEADTNIESHIQEVSYDTPTYVQEANTEIASPARKSDLETTIHVEKPDEKIASFIEKQYLEINETTEPYDIEHALVETSCQTDPLVDEEKIKLQRRNSEMANEIMAMKEKIRHLENDNARLRQKFGMKGHIKLSRRRTKQNFD